MNASEVLDGSLNQEIAGHPIGDAGERLAPSNEDKPTLQIDALSSWLRTASQHGLLSREQEYRACQAD
jgi:hypothetical protein